MFHTHVVLLRSSRSTSRSRSSTAIEWDRDRDLCYSIFTDFRWAIASRWWRPNYQFTTVIMRNALDFVGRDWSALHKGMTSVDSQIAIHANPPSPTSCRHTVLTACLSSGGERSKRLISIDCLVWVEFKGEVLAARLNLITEPGLLVSGEIWPTQLIISLQYCYVKVVLWLHNSGWFELSLKLSWLINWKLHDQP